MITVPTCSVASTISGPATFGRVLEHDSEGAAPGGSREIDVLELRDAQGLIACHACEL